MPNHSFSLILPAFNEAKNLSATVENALSALSHIVSELEILIVNDGSTDSTPASGQAHGHATGTETSSRDIPARTTPSRGGAPETTHKEAIPGE
jgi:cellulose synthase/poly-beta-1,6-N-acetylglucosamine synthase-like glycosyltransferase